MIIEGKRLLFPLIFNIKEKRQNHLNDMNEKILKIISFGRKFHLKDFLFRCEKKN